MSSASPAPATGTAREVFLAFLRLGLTSFGGPIAHLGYFRREFVQRRRWLDDERYAQLLAVCQFLPGPASSQLGFAIGLQRAGARGALAAFVGFTLPSALLLFAYAALLPHLGARIADALTHGLKLVAVAVVAQGVWAMARTLAPDAPRRVLAVLAATLVLAIGSAWAQLAAIALGAVLGPWLCRRLTAPDSVAFAVPYATRVAWLASAVFALGLIAALVVPLTAPTLPTLAAAFYRAGALVFGGGHVVLPLLEHATVDTGWLSADAFLAGYGAAQAVPGPMFSLAALLGAQTPTGAPAALNTVVALLAIFAPGFLLLTAALPLWNRIAGSARAARAVAGVNAAVVGVLAAALYDPIWIAGIAGLGDVVIAAVAFALLTWLRRPPLWAVVWCVLAAVTRALLL
ncbi:chromate efflux transporter [Lysobacter silvisoli]|nr:chromate efflux transporter [Lysobacter silvisoli]